MSSPDVNIVAATPTGRVEFLIPNSSFKVTISPDGVYVQDLSKAFPEQVVVRVWRTDR